MAEIVPVQTEEISKEDVAPPISSPSQLPLRLESNPQSTLSTSESSSSYVLVPLPDNFPVIFLNSESTDIGRSLLTKMKIMANDNPKKMSVSRHQLQIKVKDEQVTLKLIGLNRMYVQKSSKHKHWLSQGEEVGLQHGDVFTLFGEHFPFQLKHIGSTMPDRGWIGKRVKVYWALERQWFKGKVRAYDAKFDEYEIVYDDGDMTWEVAEDLILLDDLNSNASNSSSTSHKRPHKRSKETSPGTVSGSLSKRQKLHLEPQRRSQRIREGVSYYDWTSSESEKEYFDGRAVKANDHKEDHVKYVETVLTKADLPNQKTAVLYNGVCLMHLVPKHHRETPQRLQSVTDGIKSLVIKYPENLDLITEFPPCPRNIVALCHEDGYLSKLDNFEATEVPKQIFNESTEESDMDTFMSKNSLIASYQAVGAVVHAIDLIACGKYRNVFCAVRPPGHHCGFQGPTKGAATQGYCILNNVAIASLYAQAHYPAYFERIAVIDFDVHHGNGTEQILGNKDGFFFASVHVAEIFPYTGSKDVERPNNVLNVPLPLGSGSLEFQKAFETEIIPALRKFNPSVIICSAGFDGHRSDPTGALTLTEKDYFHITDQLKSVANECCQGKLISVLEGGYHLGALKRSVCEHIISLLKK